MAVFDRFTEERLGLFWRVWLTKRVIHRYLADRTYLYLKQSSSIENPDQRIAEDVRVFTATTLSFTLMFMNVVRRLSLLRSALDDKPSSIFCLDRLRSHRHSGDDLPGSAADRPEFHAVGPGGRFPVRLDPRA